MNKILLSLILVCFFSINKTLALNSTIPPLAGKWQLILNEEFNEFNPELWSYGDSWKDSVPPVNAINFFNNENVKCKNGKLILTTKKEELLYLNKENKVRKYNYSTGAINSFGKFKFKYGYIEAAIKNPVAKGLWSAFWLMPDRRKSPKDEVTKKTRSTYIIKKSKELIPGKGMEIDIMEHLSEWDHKKFSYAIHWDGYKDKLKSFEGRYIVKKHLKDDFIRFGLYWNPEKLIWFSNGEQVAESSICRIADVPMYIILNGFVGGWAKDKKSYDGLPDQMEVDYLRIWQQLP